MNPKARLSFRGTGLPVLAAITAVIVLSARPAMRVQASPIPSSMALPTPCALPAPALTSPQLVIPIPGAQGTLPGGPASGDPVLEITCLSLDREWYLEGMPWQVTVLVENVGAGDFIGSYYVFLDTCRDEGGIGWTCIESLEETINGSSLSVGGANLNSSAALSWAPPLDPLPTGYLSHIAGLPDDGPVFVRAHVTYFVPGLGLLETNAVLASATFPRGPAANDLSQDADGDGWAPPEDCEDANPAIYPWANEIVDNTLDDDCTGGDTPATDQCPSLSEIYHDSGVCGDPPNRPSPPSHDNDGDGYPAGDSSAIDPLDLDCNDFDSAIHPGALEQPDGEDDNCNGMVDEGWAEPDWVIEDFTLAREMGPSPLFPEFPWSWDTSFYNVGGIRYDVSIANVGDFIGDDLTNIQAVTIEIPFTGGIVASGTSGFIPYSDLPDGIHYGCSSRSLFARVATNGVWGETAYANNLAVADLPFIGIPDRDFRLSEAPEVSTGADRDSLSILAHGELVGTCPPESTSSNGEPFPRIRRRVFIEAAPVYDDTVEGLGNTVIVQLDDRLRHNDRVCVEVILDPSDGIAEVDEVNNAYLQLFAFKNPIIGSPHVELLDAWSDGPGMTCAGGESIEPEAVTTVTGSLTSTGGELGLWIAGLGGAIVMGVLGGGLSLIGRRMIHLAGSQATAVLIAGVGVGAVLGGFGSAALLSGLASRPDPRRVEVPPAIESPPSSLFPMRGEHSLPSCDLFVDPASASPAEGSAHLPGEQLLLDLDLASGYMASTSGDADSTTGDAGTRFVLGLTSPTGGLLQVTWVTDPSGEDLPALNPVLAAYAAGSGVLAQQGTFGWEIIRGEAAVGGGRFAAMCAGSTLHHFVVGASVEGPPLPTGTPEPGVTPPTATPSPTASPSPSPSPLPPTRTSTPTATPIPDTTGPSFKSVSDSPDPIYVNQPAGCSPNTSIVSVSVSDPSGVASVVVLFFHTTIGAVPMTHTGGDNWQATLGPYAGVGDGTVDYQVRTTDNQGNISESAFFQITVVACIP